MPVIPTRASPGRQKGKLQLLLERAGFCYKYRARSKSSRTTRMALFNKPSDTICSVPLLRRAMYLCFGWKHKGFRAAGSKMQRRRWPLLLIHLSLQAFGRHKRLHLFSRLPLKTSYLDKDLTYPRLICFSCKIRGWCIRSIQAEGSLSEFRFSLTPTLQDAEKKNSLEIDSYTSKWENYSTHPPRRAQSLCLLHKSVWLQCLSVHHEVSRKGSNLCLTKWIPLKTKPTLKRTFGVTQMGRGRKRSKPYSRQKEMKIQG